MNGGVVGLALMFFVAPVLAVAAWYFPAFVVWFVGLCEYLEWRSTLERTNP